MFRTILIANRGEIACRVIRTARRMGIRTVAVFSEADRDALHVRMADEAWYIGRAPARESYLLGDAIIAAAKRAGAEAIHPGYGFLSENAEFAGACMADGIVFIGPPPAAIRAMGSKSAAKALMEKAGVKLVPGYHGAEQDPGFLQAQAETIGYPVLIKASAGGGGKGMRVVENPVDFAAALEVAQGEARASFGDDRVLIERYLTRPRHIEIQVFADTHGNIVHLFERDCSIQRRHQKVIEEAPAPGMDAARRAAMGQAACEAARAIGYVGAGTVEFIAEGDDFFFMEMNTRLQVEHPVTEMITGQDLVEWQLRVAAGEELPSRQQQISLTGHAIEARVYAEDPARDWMPSTGVLNHLRPPQTGPHIRLDTGVRAGDAISVHYDPMIAKLIAWGEDRDAALRHLATALDDYEVAGVRTNLPLLRRIAVEPEFQAGAVDTGFLGRHPRLLAATEDTPPALAFAAALATLLAEGGVANPPGDPHSPWGLANAWRLNGAGYQDLLLRAGAEAHEARVFPGTGGAFTLQLGRARHEILRPEPGTLILDGVRRRIAVARSGDAFTVLADGGSWTVELVDKLHPKTEDRAGGDLLTAPMPGRVVRLLAEPGSEVTRGAVMLVLEAMKVQMRLTAPCDGVVEAVRVAEGDLVEEGAELIRFRPPD